MSRLFTPAVRKRLYLALSALLPLAAVYGLIDQDQVSMWLTLAVAILGTGGTVLAAANTPQTPSVDDVVEDVRQRAGDLLESSTSQWPGIVEDVIDSATSAWPATGRHAKGD
ncbi:hypothetical protein [Gordonia sp. SND2]|uniref:hypothetical protein n=1 Tax=Gordonia sp. SND2 TaxID=3388659 RepID=UPI00398B3F79